MATDVEDEGDCGEMIDAIRCDKVLVARCLKDIEGEGEDKLVS